MLSAAQLQSYRDNGYLIVENLIPPATLDHIRSQITQLTEKASTAPGLPSFAQTESTTPGDKAPLRKLNELCPIDPFFLQVASTPTLLDIASQLTANARQIFLYSDQVFLKPALCGSEKPLHQDNSYFKVTPHDFGVTCWMAIDDATVENGCLHYIPGSHKLGLLTHKQVGPAHLSPEQPFDRDKEVPAPVRAGGCIFHHLLCLHGSRANKSPLARRAWALHYANRDAQSAVKPWDKMIQVR